MNQDKRTIYDVLNEEEGDGTYSTKEDVLNCVKDVLKEEYCYGSGGLELEDEGIAYMDFCKKVTDVLFSGDISFDESWDNGEVYMMIENVATDVLVGDI